MMLVMISSAMKSRAALELENIALRHQLGVLQRSPKKLSISEMSFCHGINNLLEKYVTTLPER